MKDLFLVATDLGLMKSINIVPNFLLARDVDDDANGSTGSFQLNTRLAGPDRPSESGTGCLATDFSRSTLIWLLQQCNVFT